MKSLCSICRMVCDSLHEFNPMMGHRGCRLAVTYPEIARMQTRAVMARRPVCSECILRELCPQLNVTNPT